MLIRKAVLTLLIGLLSVIGLSASDQDCSSCAPKKKTQDCACAPKKKAPDCACAPEKRTPDCTCAPQKTQDCCVYTPTRSIVPLIYESQATRRKRLLDSSVLHSHPRREFWSPGRGPGDGPGAHLHEFRRREIAASRQADF